jgi:DNA-directed RNA polymerase sigma subunit (sigma70/sigma32)
MATSLWPADDGWPYPDDPDVEASDHSADVDDDLVSLRACPPHLWDELEAVERQVVTAHYGLDGRAPRTMKQLRDQTGMSRSEVRQTLVTGLEKLRSRMGG